MGLYIQNNRKRNERPTRRSVTRVDASAPVPTERGLTVREAVVDFLTYHRNKGSAPATVAQYAYYLDDRTPKRKKYLPLIAWATKRGYDRIRQLDKAACQDFIDQMKAHGAKSTGEGAVVMLKRLMDWCLEEGHIEGLPIRLKEPKRRSGEVKVFSDEEMTRIAKVVHKENVRDQAIFYLLLDAGMRASEVLTLELPELRLDKREVIVRAEVAKSGKSRTIPLNASVGPLKAWLRERGEIPNCPWVFLSFAGTPVFSGGRGNAKRRTSDRSLRKFLSPAPLTRIGIYQLVRKWGKLANVTEARNSPHTYRHYFGVTYLRNGGDVFTLKEILGHAHLDMTMVYAKMAQTDVKRVHNTASPAQRFLPRRAQRVEGDDD